MQYEKKLNVDKVVDSKMSREVFQRAEIVNRGVPIHYLLVILGIQWSDDFDLNSSSKINRGSVWMKTVTFISSAPAYS